MKDYVREYTLKDIISVRNPNVVAIGGGTGLSTLLRGLKQYTKNLTAVVTMGDDGGSSGRLRDDLGLAPPGDIRNCILALADDETVMQELFNYRFKKGTLDGHSFGNLFLAAMDGISQDFFQAIKRTSDILQIKGKVLPVTLDPMILVGQLKNGEKVTGESEIPEAVIKTGNALEKLTLKNQDHILPLNETLEVIRDANIIVIGPGSLFTSLISNLLVPGIVEEISKSKAKKYYIANIMTQPGETDAFSQIDHVRQIIKHSQGKISFDKIIQHNGSIPEDIAKFYRENNQEIIQPIGRESEFEVITSNLIHIDKDGKIRHNADKVAELIFQTYVNE